MGKQLLLLVVGVLLTSGLGGLIGTYFQSRTWNHQRLVANRDRERTLAIAYYEELSCRFDRRLYRMRRVDWAARAVARGGPSQPFDNAVTDYREVLNEWNETINRVLAFGEIYFGIGVRKLLEHKVYEDFAAAGRAVDLVIKLLRRTTEGAVMLPRLDHKLRRLGSTVLSINLTLLGLIRADTIALDAPTVVNDLPASNAVGRPFAEIGDTGAHVTRLQQAVAATKHHLGPADGVFGLDTWSALRSFQGENGLEVDGVAGPTTTSALALS